jgi:hypothetical protein
MRQYEKVDGSSLANEVQEKQPTLRFTRTNRRNEHFRCFINVYPTDKLNYGTLETLTLLPKKIRYSVNSTDELKTRAAMVNAVRQQLKAAIDQKTIP